MKNKRAYLKICETAAVISAVAAGTAWATGKTPEGGWYEPKNHGSTDYSEIKYEGYDRARMDALIEEMEEICKGDQKGREKRVEEIYQDMLSEIDWLSTQQQLNNLIYYKDVHNEEAQEESQKLDKMGNELVDRMAVVLKEALDSSYGPFLREIIGENGTRQLEEYEPMTEREFALSEQEMSLVQEYDQAMMESYTAVVDGEEWTTERYEEEPPEDYDENYKIYTALLQEKNSVTAEIYRELVQIRNEIAAENGYDNYADYAYAEIYERDFTTKEIKKVYEAVKKYIIPLYEDGRTAQTMTDERSLEKAIRGKKGEDILDEIEPFISEVHPDLAEAFSYMRQYHFYDIEKDEKKMDMAFTTDLPSYGAPFIFNNPYGYYEYYGDYGTLIHEFGHYNQMFHDTEPVLWQTSRMDVYEIHSQGLEMLFYPYADDLFGKGGEAFQYETVNNMLYGIREGCLYDEFQNLVYKNPDMTIEEINRAFLEISREYGYYYEEEEDQAYGWVEVPHTFESPMYYIGYGTSALTALDIWVESLDNREEAVNKYMQLTALGGSKPYRQVVMECGLQDIFEEGTISSIADSVRRTMKIDEKTEAYENRGYKVLMNMAAILACLYLSGVILAVALARRTIKKQAAARERKAWNLTGGTNIPERYEERTDRR